MFRETLLEDVEALTLSTSSSEFLIHYYSESDDRLMSMNHRDQIIETILFVKTLPRRNSFLNAQLGVYFVKQINLDLYMTTEEDMEEGFQIRPEETDLRMLNYKDFQKRLRKENQKKLEKRQSTRTLYSLVKKKVTVEDFELLKILGKGAHGKVILCQPKSGKKELFAMKVLKKQHIIEKNQLEHTQAEQRILKHVNYPFLVSLRYSFQTGSKIYFVMQFMKGGELFQHLRRVKRFSEEEVRFIIACVTLGIGHLHNKSYIYRDLKPENILFDEQGYAHLSDFGLAKFLLKSQKANTFCGTPEYLSPEIILDKGCNNTADWWSLGVLCYEMLFGIPPFYSSNIQKMYKNTILKDLKFRRGVQVSEQCKDFIARLLVKNPKSRLGAVADSLEIISHPWLENFPFQKLIEKKLKPPYDPFREEKDWTKFFDPAFTSQNPTDSYCWVDPKLLKDFRKDFEMFDFDNQNWMSEEEQTSDGQRKYSRTIDRNQIGEEDKRKSVRVPMTFNDEKKRLLSTPRKFKSQNPLKIKGVFKEEMK